MNLCGQVAVCSQLKTHIWSELLLSTLRKIAVKFSQHIAQKYQHRFSISITPDYVRESNWNIITFLLVMVVCIHNWASISVIFVCRSHSRAVDCGLWLSSFAFCSLLHISTGHVSQCEATQRELSTFFLLFRVQNESRASDGCAKLFNENNDHVIKV